MSSPFNRAEPRINVVPIGLIPDSTASATTNRQIINSAIDTVNSLGGGFVTIPKGNWYVSGTGNAVDGCIQLKDNVTLEGLGKGVTNIILQDQYNNDTGDDLLKITGIIRTPSGQITRHAGIRNLTIDGNRSKQTLGITTITFSGTTATVTTDAAHGLSNGDEVAILGATDELYNDIVTITVTGASTFTYTMDGTPSGNAVAGMSYVARGVRGAQTLSGISVSSNVATATISASSSLGTDPIATTNTSTTLTITLTDHGYLDNTVVLLAGASATNGVPAGEINTNHDIFNVTANTFDIEVSTAATSTGTGGGSSITAKHHGLAIGDKPVINGCSEQAINGEAVLTAITGDTFSWSVASADGAKSAGLSYSGVHDGFYCGVTPSDNDNLSGNSNSIKKDEDIFVFDCEIKGCTHYGCDPHEQTLHFRANRNDFYNNLYDGAVADLLVDSDYSDNNCYINGRHGFNVVTRTSNLNATNIKTHSNGWHNGSDKGNGISVQNGSTIIDISNAICLKDSKRGIACINSSHIQGSSIHVDQCGENGLWIEGCDSCVFNAGHLDDIGQTADATYEAIRVKDGDSNSRGVIITSFECHATKTNKMKQALYASASNKCVYSDITSNGHTSDQAFRIDDEKSIADNLVSEITTTNASAKDVLQLALSTSSTAMVEFSGVAWNATDSTSTAFKINQSADNIAGTVTLRGTADPNFSYTSSTETATLNVDSTKVDARVTGITGKTIRWRLKFDIIKQN